MKKLLVGAALAVSMLAAAPAANAAQYINLPAPAADGTVSGIFGNDAIAKGAFTNTFNFTFPGAGFGGSTISSVLTGLGNATNIDFSSVKLNGVEFIIASTGVFESRYLSDLVITGGPQQLIVQGTSGGNGSYAGTLSFAPSAAVPEPATWAMMIIGFTGAGVAIRRRRRDDSVAFA
jgi:opacity protein-like surface antigen